MAVKLCECGCGQPVGFAQSSNKHRGMIKGQPNRFIFGHSSKGANNPHWNGGRYQDVDGRWHVDLPDGRRMLEHRYIMEQMLGRPLLPTEVVHHKDGDHSNNDPDNLQLAASQGEHTAILHYGYTEEHLLEMLSDLAKQIRHIPSEAEIDRMVSMPHSKTYRNRFSSYQKALLLSGVLKGNENEIISAKIEKSYNRFLCTFDLLSLISELQAAELSYKKIGDFLNEKQIPRKNPDLPWNAPIVHFFLKNNGWKKRKSTHKPKYTREEMLQRLQKYTIEHGIRPFPQAWQESKQLPSITQYKRRFGSWSNALKEAGLLQS